MTNQRRIANLVENLTSLNPEFRDLAVQAIRCGIGSWDKNGCPEFDNFVHALTCINGGGVPYMKEEVLSEAARLANVQAVMDS